MRIAKLGIFWSVIVALVTVIASIPFTKGNILPVWAEYILNTVGIIFLLSFILLLWHNRKDIKEFYNEAINK